MSDFDLNDKAKRAVLAAGFAAEFPPEVVTEVERVTKTGGTTDGAKDLRHLEWSSIDNEDSKDLDQVEFAQRENDGRIRLLVGIADVAGLVRKGGAIDAHAEKNTTTLYVGPRIFPMLPEELSTNATSLLENQDRRALVVEMIVEKDGHVQNPFIYPAVVRNHARLSYEEAGDFLESRGDSRIAQQEWLARQLRLQAEASERLMELRKRAGALTFSSIEPRVIKRGEQLIDLKLVQQNRARDLIESSMIAANMAAAEFLKSRGWPIVDRVVAAPKRWDRIREIALRYGTDLPLEPDRKALSEFLAGRRKTDPEKFADLSLAIVKLLGPGEYIIEYPGGPQQSHFGLAVDDYSHSTAPNRRFADLLLQRLMHALLARQPSPYSKPDLERLAAHCNERQTAERKVERLMRKVCAALLLQSKIGQSFRGIITGATEKGTFVRLFDFPAEGKIVRGARGLDVGDKVSVRLIGADPENGFIDFEPWDAP